MELAKACAASRCTNSFYIFKWFLKRVEPIAAEFGSENLVYPCDVSKPEIKKL